MYMYMHIYVYIYVCTYVCMYIYVCVYIYICADQNLLNFYESETSLYVLQGY